MSILHLIIKIIDMLLKGLQQRLNIKGNAKLSERYAQTECLIDELKERRLPEHLILKINLEISKLNQINDCEKTLKCQLSKSLWKITNALEKEIKVVSVNHYRNIWLSIGMAVFGVPLGVVFGLILNNMAFIGIGLPIGLTLGMAIGVQMDNKAKEEGRQLKMELSL